MQGNLEVVRPKPGSETIDSSEALAVRALQIQDQINDQPVDTATKIQLAEAAVSYLDKLCAGLYLYEPVTCAGTYQVPVIGGQGGVVSKQNVTGVAEGYSMGFSYELETWSFDEGHETAVERIEIGHVLQLVRGKHISRFGVVEGDYWVFAPIISNNLRSKAELDHDQLQETLARFDPTDETISDIDVEVYAEQSLNLLALAEIFRNVQIKPVQTSLLDDYLTYLNLITDWSGKTIVIAAPHLYKTNEKCEQEAYSTNEDIAGLCQGFCFSPAIKVNHDLQGYERQPGQDLCLAVEVNHPDGSQAILRIPANAIEVYLLDE